MTGRWGALVVVLAAVAALSLGSAAGSCRFAFDCHLRPAPSYRESAAATLARIRKEPATGAVQAAPGLRDEVVTAGFELPTDFTFLPGGDVLVAEMGGRVVRLRDGGRRRTVLLDLRDRVSTTYFRGLTAIAVDPHYRRNHHLYVVYAVRREETEGRDAPTTVRVSRFTAGEGEGSEQVLLGTVAGGSCDDREAVADCIPANVDHIGAGLAFARDGSLFVSTGDGGRVQDDVELASLRAQDPDSLGGKVLRITRDGQGIRDNPFWTGDPSANASKVWAVGLRNPFRMSLSTGRPPLLGDVGEARFEEIDAVPRGANLGWPCYEGRFRNALYEPTI
ncbi:MAG TPA: PQQ-dependent sugar dehydrogenase, partial [Gaiellaceae bacterium]|nr:PQQ-dependent sugar dehydrogenase [Gaiellaceae bacterium]